MARSIDLFNLRVSTLNMQDTVSECERMIDASRALGGARRPSLVFAINPEKIIRAVQDQEIKRLLDRAAILIPDGIGVCMAARVIHGVALHRVAGSDLMPALCELAAERDYSVYLYGGGAESSTAAAAELIRRFPGLRIVGRADGYTPMSGPGGPLEQIRELRPDIVFVALGSPKQEQFMVDWGAELPVGIMQGVGGTIDVLAGKVKRAPRAFRAVGLEWLYRLLAQPTRWRRQLALIEFARQVLRVGRRGRSNPPVAS